MITVDPAASGTTVPTSGSSKNGRGGGWQRHEFVRVPGQPTVDGLDVNARGSTPTRQLSGDQFGQAAFGIVDETGDQNDDSAGSSPSQSPLRSASGGDGVRQGRRSSRVFSPPARGGIGLSLSPTSATA